MSQVTKPVPDPGKTIEQQIISILAIMSEDVRDGTVLQRMLEQALDMNNKCESQTLAEIRGKYGA